MLERFKYLFATNWKKQTVIVITVTCILINSFGIVLYFKNDKINASKNWVFHSYQVLAQTRTMLTDMQTLEIAQREYLLLGKNDFLQNFDLKANDILKQSDDLSEMVKDNPSQSNKALVIKKNILLQETSLKEQVTSLKSKDSISLGDIALRSELLANTKNSIDEFVKDERSLLNDRIEKERVLTHNFVNTLIFGSAFAVIALLGANGLVLFYSSQGTKSHIALLKSQKIYDTVIQGINEGVYEYNVPNKTIFFSASFKKMLGYEDNEFANSLEMMNESIHPEDFKNTWEVVNNYFNKKTNVYRNFFRMRHRDGYYIWIMSRGVGLWDDKGQIQKLVGTHTDITEQKENEEYLKRLNSEIENFTYITSHDLRSPLVNLKGFSSELQYNVDELAVIMEESKKSLSEALQKSADTILKKDMPEALNYIKSSIDRLDQLTSAILDLSKIGRREIRIEAIDTKNVVQQCVNSLAFEIQEKGINIDIGIVPPVNSDLISISQIFSNIIENAIKYLDPKRHGIIKISGKINPGEVEFCIKDNGRGIDDSDKPKIFDMFKRARNVENIRGVGMGMSYVKATVQRLGGKIWFESELDVGTEFIFTIPNRMSRGN